MKREEYNADLVCRAMGLPGFVEEAWNQPRFSAVRIILTPSLYNEVAITVVERNGDVSISARALLERFRGLVTASGFSPHVSSECKFGYGLFQQTVAMFLRAREESINDQSPCLDGMGMRACLVAGGDLLSFKINVAASWAAAELARKLIEWSWTLLEDDYLRNALARCGAQVGRKYQLKRALRYKPSLDLLILGDAPDRAEVSRAIEQVVNKRYFEQNRRNYSSQISR